MKVLLYWLRNQWSHNKRSVWHILQNISSWINIYVSVRYIYPLSRIWVSRTNPAIFSFSWSLSSAITEFPSIVTWLLPSPKMPKIFWSTYIVSIGERAQNCLERDTAEELGTVTLAVRKSEIPPCPWKGPPGQRSRKTNTYMVINRRQCVPGWHTTFNIKPALPQCIYLPRAQLQPKFLSHISHTKLYTKDANGVEGALYSMAHWLENSLVK